MQTTLTYKLIPFFSLCSKNKKEEPVSEPSCMLQFTCGFFLSHVSVRTMGISGPLTYIRSGASRQSCKLWWRCSSPVGCLFPLACTEVNLTWLNTVMSHTKLLWPVLTQRRVCTAPCWLWTHISNTSDIHSPTAVTLTLCSCCVALRFPDKHYLLWHGAPGHNVACVVSLVKLLSPLLGCRSSRAVSAQSAAF